MSGENLMASTTRKTTQKKEAETAPNQPRDYIVLKKFRLGGEYVFPKQELTLKPSQAEYHLVNNRLKQKDAK